MDYWDIMLIRMPVAVVSVYILWSSAKGYLDRRRRGLKELPVDRAMRYFISLIALFVLFGLGVVLMSSVGMPVMVFYLLMGVFVLSALGMLVCGAMVGYYWFDDVLDVSEENGGKTG